MANKFTKSVLERQAKEMKARSSKPAEEGIRPAAPAAGAVGAAVEPAPAEPQPPAQLERPEPIPAVSGTTPSADLPIPAEPAAPLPSPAPESPAGEGGAKPRAARKAAAPLPDLTAFIVRDEGRSAKNKTFYLDEAVIDALHRAAVAQKITDSKLVNDILKKILGV